jgi:branched-chain amino acid transport system substrate-binding protein
MKKRNLNASHPTTNDPLTNASRRRFIKSTATAALVAGASSVLPRFARAEGRPIKIGIVSPKTGPLADFAEPEPFILAGISKVTGNRIVVNGTTHPIEILYRDSQSNPNRAAEVAAELIKSDKVDLILPSHTPDVVNPASDQAELNGVPCISTDCPLHSFIYGRGNPAGGFEWTYNFFWGEDDLIDVYTDIWSGLPTNKVVGALWGDDTDGATDLAMFPSVMSAKGYKVINPGSYPMGTSDFSAQIAAYKGPGAEILIGEIVPPSFSVFWSQVWQQNYKPKIVTMAKASLFPAAVNALGDRATGLTTEVWWSPHHPFKSSLTGQSAAQLCDAWEKESGKQWTPPVGFAHGLMEVGLDVLKRTKNIDSPAAIVDAIRTTNLDTIVGHIQWTGNPSKNCCRTPLVGGQWVKGTKFKYELLIVSNEKYKQIPMQAKLKPLSYQI